MGKSGYGAVMLGGHRTLSGGKGGKKKKKGLQQPSLKRLKKAYRVALKIEEGVILKKEKGVVGGGRGGLGGTWRGAGATRERE